jgi:hypothetical protein
MLGRSFMRKMICLLSNAIANVGYIPGADSCQSILVKNWNWFSHCMSCKSIILYMLYSQQYIKQPMKLLLPIIGAVTLFLSSAASADCVNGQYGSVVCGEGQCQTDGYGKVFCADTGGGAIRDRYGKVLCGIGYCAKDNLGQVWCSKERDGGVAVDSYGEVKCFGGCEIASSKLCKEAQ